MAEDLAHKFREFPKPPFWSSFMEALLQFHGLNLSGSENVGKKLCQGPRSGWNPNLPKSFY